jgi:DNA-binding MarR family transcriptional regulator
MAKTPKIQGSQANDNHDGAPSEELTDKQGQYLAYIALYTKLHRRPPAEADMQEYFRVTPPTAHRMVVELEQKGWIRREPGKARSIEVLVAADKIPPLR